ncbi:MAG: aminoglycoside phosphotransferase family protein [Prosthecobacter sp.]|jgi:fructosamine-3-kinase|uniref:phosphotransferase n=1 Tax=Prosthecobacter sp. TaxID=1965333 RepID=UPI0019FB046C|nr:aminoglycoside phosphotransferase family protein [Prosthecobacter sp.]MBE2284030.1 aminoglycoside phosphotransferase family protein [Prosthecobacter sp.]
MNRRDIYYWKCDRTAAFHGTQSRGEADANLAAQLEKELCRHFDTKNVVLSPGAGQGNHLTWNAEVDGKPLFVRVENGPEKDAHLAVESALLDRVRAAGVVTPRVFGCDASRIRVSFAWQALERVSVPDLNHWFKQGTLEVPKIAFEIGAAVAKWQAITLEGFGVLDEQLRGYRTTYADYFHLRLDDHLRFLTQRGFLANADEIRAEIESHRALLQLEHGCLVHKDLALWNILGIRDQIAAFIDFDDSIAGDPMDDLSLLACFHDAAFLRRAFEGYQSVRELPQHHLQRFWLHLLRNMIVKAVIRVGAGYFDRDDGFFLISSGSSGSNLREITLSKLAIALRGLREDSGLDILSP